MQETLALLKHLAPDLAEELGRRALVLERIAALQPVGRRVLAARLNLPEREVRSVAAALRGAGLITLDAAGMALTSGAQAVLPGAREMSRAMYGLTMLEKQLEQSFGIRRAYVVAGDADEEPQVKRDVGRTAALRVRAMLQSGMTMAVTGGSTMSEVARGMQPSSPLNVMVVPARGGMGRTVETQASTIAAEIASRLGGHYRVMHLPDNVDAATVHEMMKLPEVREAVELLQRADVVVYGIGRADVMARQRQLAPALVQHLLAQGAVAEAFGEFFDAAGKTVYRMSTVSGELGRLKPGSLMVAVAAGANKAQAIRAALLHRPHEALITDEGAARAMLALPD